MDIGNSKSVADREEEGTEIEVRDVRGEVEEGVTITVVGTYSTTYTRAQKRNRDKYFRQRLDGDTLEKQSLETVARCIKSWKGFTSNGQEFPYTTDNAVLLLANAPWIREQVEGAMNDHASFFPTPSGN